MNAVEASGLIKRFGETVILDGVDLSVAEGEVVALIGPSGSGKSTLLRCLAGLEPLDGGALRVAGVEAGGRTPLARALGGRVGFVFQGFNLFPHRTAVQNVMEGPVTVRRERPAAAREKAMALLAKVGLAERADAYPRELSGGQQQRCAIARALAMEPEVILFDEPTSALDPISTGRIEELIEQLRDEFTIVIVTHNMQQAARISQFTAFMYLGELIEFGPTNRMFMNPVEQRTQDYITGRFG